MNSIQYSGLSKVNFSVWCCMDRDEVRIIMTDIINMDEFPYCQSDKVIGCCDGIHSYYGEIVLCESSMEMGVFEVEYVSSRSFVRWLEDHHYNINWLRDNIFDEDGTKISFKRLKEDMILFNVGRFIMLCSCLRKRTSCYTLMEIGKHLLKSESSIISIVKQVDKKIQLQMELVKE